MNLHVNLIFFQLNKTVNQIVTYQTPYMRYVLYDVGISAVLYALSFFDCQKKQILFIQSCSLHSMAGANLNKCVWLVTNTTTASKYIPTLESGIDVGQGITVGPGKFVKKNKRRALNKRRA